MAEASHRVALLARAGLARDNLTKVLADAGAELVLVADPNDASPEAISSAGAGAVLVALEPAIEDALERYDAILHDPSLTLIFDEADLAAKRDGWDAARWTRHVAAKLNRHDDVLPPASEPDSDGAPSNEARAAGLDAVDFDDGAHAWSGGTRDVQAPIDDAAFFSAIGVEQQSIAPESDDVPVRVPDNDGGAEPAPGSIDVSALSLIEDDHLPQPTSQVRKADLSGLEHRISGLSLVEDVEVEKPGSHGAALIDGGLGGADAVRQLLAELPIDFPRPVVVRLRIDGGRYDRLSTQMGKSSRMPVSVADGDDLLRAGHVYVMPPGYSLARSRAGLRFEPVADDLGSLPAALDADDSAVVLLSGSPEALAQAVSAPEWSGALIAAQSPEGCYDATAANVLIARGMVSGSPGEIAGLLGKRWNA